MGCGGSVPVHPIQAAEWRPQDEGADDQTLQGVRVDEHARIAALEGQLAQALSEVSILQAQLEGPGDAQRPGVQEVGGAETATARGGEGIRTPGGAKIDTAESIAPTSEREEGVATDALQVQEFACGLQERLREALVIGLATGLGLNGAEDPRNIAALLAGLTDDGKGLVQEHCVPLMVQCVVEGVQGLREAHDDTVAAANSRYADDPAAYVASMGNITEFERGLDCYNGRPDGDNVELQMQLEFADSTSFKTSNYGGVETKMRYADRNQITPKEPCERVIKRPTLKRPCKRGATLSSARDPLTLELPARSLEWEFVVNPQPDKVYPGEVGLPKPGGGRYPGRNRKTIDSLMKHPTAKKAKLTREEVIATRLYTGPPYMFLNRGLRSGGRDAKKKGVGNFPATCAAFNSAIKKLRLVTVLPPGRKLYRGLTNMALPQAVLDQGAFVELGFSSATPNGEVAKGYAGSARSSLFEIDVGQIDRGAFIGEFSQYEDEDEHVLPPLSHFEIVGKARKFGVNVYHLRLNVNLRAQTLEELQENRRNTALDLASRLDQDCAHLLGRDSREIAKIVAGSIEPVGAAFFNQAQHFSEIVGKLEEALVRELGDEAEALRAAAETMPAGEARGRVAKLRRRVKICKRCSRDDAAGKQQVLAAQEEVVAALLTAGMGDSEAADDQVELALLREETTSDLAGAMEMLERALQVKLSLSPPAPEPEVALIMHRQGRVLDSMGKFEEALVQYQKALDIRVSALGRDHPLVADTKENIGLVLKTTDKASEAKALFEEAASIRRQVFGSSHAKTKKSEELAAECT